ncbi:hypothetical protein [Azovibrio restrictus]|uniref:ABC-type transport auxiliary lipoprotein family protein n=1 Tax=Azovibrio restrictus TaxID=146938 RepID=UPI0026EF9DDE|nr:hypothetical protein [Azovibrio restrictus]MDD3483139.1 hypothetical protein [Azovibrio restrictus]
MRILILLLASLLLAACTSPAYRNGNQPVAQFDLGPVAAPGGLSVRPWRFSVSAGGGLEDVAMRYRLAYADPARVMEYAQSRWVSGPAELLQRRLESRLYWTGAQAADACELYLELRRFEQVFSSPVASTGVLGVRVLLRRKTGAVVDETLWTLEEPAPTPDAAGGVQALAGAADRLAGMLQDWRGAGAARGGRQNCQE